jgi:hypothetical protein
MILLKNGGEIVEFYKANSLSERAKFRCSEGHEWETRIGRVIGNEKSWCRKCKLKQAGLNKLVYSFDEYNKKAEEYGGKLISDKYVNANFKYIWQCKNGHIFEAKWGNVNNNKWCRKCLYLTIEQMKAYAVKRGGKCLSEEYINIKSPLKWECKYEHQWEARGIIVNGNNWCPICNESTSGIICRKILEFLFKKEFPTKRPTWLKYKRNLELDCYNEKLKIALEYNGPQHYKEVSWYKTTTLDERKAMDVFKEQKCVEEKVFLIVIPYTIKTDDFYKTIRTKCIPYLQEETPETLNLDDLNIKDTKSEKMNELQVMVEQKGGSILSKRYLNNYSKMKFCCAKGHEFESTFSVVLSGSWCSRCAFGMFRINGLDKIKKFIEENEGKLISESYENMKIPIEYMCKEGHKYKRPVDSIKNLTFFCSKCRISIKGKEHLIFKKSI